MSTDRGLAPLTLSSRRRQTIGEPSATLLPSYLLREENEGVRRRGQGPPCRENVK